MHIFVGRQDLFIGYQAEVRKLSIWENYGYLLPTLFGIIV